MQSKSFDWHEYLSAPIFEKEETPDSIERDKLWAKLFDLRNTYSPILNMDFGDLREKNCPKIIIKEDVRPYPNMPKDEYKYCFRFQCMTTGRQSRYIKKEDYPRFGIFRTDVNSGHRFSYKLDIEDSTKPIKDEYYNKWRSIQDKINTLQPANITEIPRQQKYYEYLNSEQWYYIREKVLSRDENKCVLSGKGGILNAHHLHYFTIGNENIYDLMTVNRDIHNILHDSDHPDHDKYIELMCDYITTDDRFEKMDREHRDYILNRFDPRLRDSNHE